LRCNSRYSAPKGETESTFTPNIVNEECFNVVATDSFPSFDRPSSDTTLRTLVNGNGEPILASKMARLSLSVHETVLHGIHGVAEKVKETPQLPTKKLSELDAKIAIIQSSNLTPV
jgi:hypothetical protein